jgi:N-formylglutamate deformylase
MPHIGTEIPEELANHYVERAIGVEDTDWHLDRLYGEVTELGASVLTPRYSRYVIDLNRPPDDAPMYPGASNTELCPTRFFTGEPLYRGGLEPDVHERAHRLTAYWQPYHATLAKELERLIALHGYVILWDAHSIRSEIPWLFEGKLPDLNFGSADGTSAHTAITTALQSICTKHPSMSHVLNGRFKGGYITRHYGDPAQHVHAVQLEMCQSLYMQEEAPFAYDEKRARFIAPLLRSLIDGALQACKDLYER